jgi:type I pantothenate kinase
MQALLARWPTHPRVDLVATDGFLHRRRVLEQRGLMQRKGFPESYDLRALIAFLSDVKAGKAHSTLPMYPISRTTSFQTSFRSSISPTC